MDFIKKAAEGMKGDHSGSTQQSNSGDQDYVDKGTLRFITLELPRLHLLGT